MEKKEMLSWHSMSGATVEEVHTNTDDDDNDGKLKT